MRSVFRYEVVVNDEPQRHVVQGEVRKVAAACRLVDGKSLRIIEFWAETETEPADGTLLQRTFRVFGTGHPLPAGAVWRGTCDRTTEGFVWHLYEMTGGADD